jgi:uncharacterized protein
LGGIKVDYLKEFVIPFRGLSIDTHYFNFIIDKKFFEAIEYAELENGHVNVSIEMTNQERMMIFDFKIDGLIEVTCDRCLEVFNYPVSGNERLIVKYGESHQELTDEILVIPESEHEINLSAILYEYILLMLPIRRIHPEDANGKSECNAEMIRKLQQNHIAKEPDPRWDALKKLIKE